MGRGIAQSAVQAGYDTLLFDLDEPILKAAEEEISRSLFLLEKKNRITELQRQQALQRIRFTTQDRKSVV